MKKYLIPFIAVALLFLSLALPLIASAACTAVSSSFPGSLDSWVTGDCVPSALFNIFESKVGATGSAVTSSLDYQINHIFTSYGSETVASSALPWLGSNAFNSTSYLPLTGGTLTGNVTGTSATFSGTVSSTALQSSITDTGGQVYNGRFQLRSAKNFE
jgi:hypothetical protein